MKRRSATSSPPERVFFADENLGERIFPGALRDAGVSLELHSDHFEKGALDEEWLPSVGKNGWILLTLDARLRYNRLEKDAIMRSGVAAFILVGGPPFQRPNAVDVCCSAKRSISKDPASR